MSGVRDFFDVTTWKSVARQLEGEAASWWKDNQQELLSIAREDAVDIAQALARGDTVGAKIAIVGNMDRAEWRAYRDRTTTKLRGIAYNRAKVIDALTDLGTGAAEVIGRVLVAALRG